MVFPPKHFFFDEWCALILSIVSGGSGVEW
jgi:hypothetical protein